MTDEVPALTAALRPVGAARRMVLAGYSRLGRGSRRLIGVLLKLALLLYFVFCALFLSLRYAILPNIDHYQGSVEQLVSRALG